MKKNPLLGALPIIAQALGRRLGVEVVIGARDRAETDGRTIHLPPLPAESASLAVLANGYIDHEAAHLRYTDFGRPKPPGWAGYLVNLLEDIRIERALGAAYPGSRRNLAALVARLEAGAPSAPPPDAPVVAQVLGALQALLRARLLGQDALAASAAVLEARLDATLPEGVVVKLLALAFEVRHAASTAEVIALAARIVAMLREEASPPAPAEVPAPAGPPAAADDPAPTGPLTAADDPAPAGSPTTGNDPVPAGSPTTGNAPFGSSAPAADDPAPAGPPTAAASGSGAGAAIADARAAALAALLEDDAGAAPEVLEVLDVGARAGALLTAGANARPAAAVRLAEYDPSPPNVDPAGAVARARAATARLRRRLGVLVQARREDDAWRADRGRRLDPASLYRPCAGQPVRFARRAAREAPATAVGLLLDRSGSMDSLIALAGQAVLATALALEAISGVACWAAAFPGRRDDRVLPLKAFAESARRVAGRFGGPAGGGTPLAAALWRAGAELARRPEPRRLLVVATDGDPDDVEAARQIIARCRAGGIEVLGLGIGQSLASVRAVFGPDDAAAIATLAELAPALFGMLESRL